MPILYIYGPEDFEERLPDEVRGAAEGCRNWSFTLKADAEPTEIEIDDDDAVFDEMDTAQVLADDATIGGVDYPAGTGAHSSYDLSNSETGHKITGVHLGGDGWQQGAVQGVISNVDMEPGQTYTFDSERTSYLQDNAYEDYAACFAAGTLIAAVDGARPVEALRPGDLLQTAHGTASVLLVLSRALDARDLARQPKLRPVRIKAGALGAGLPERDLRVSRQHRMRVQSKIAARMFDTEHVLIAAHCLTALPNISVDLACAQITYFHLVLERHEIIFAERAPTESFYCGETGLRALPKAQRDELQSLFPDLPLRAPKSACLIPHQRRQKRCLARHAVHNRPLIPAPDAVSYNS